MLFRSPSPSPTESATPTPTEAPSPVDTTSGSPPPAVTSIVIVRTVSGLSDAEQAQVIADHGATELDSIPALRLHVVEAPGTAADATAAFSLDGRVESVDRDRTRDAEAASSDPAYPDQWALPQIGWDQVYGSANPSGSATIEIGRAHV